MAVSLTMADYKAVFVRVLGCKAISGYMTIYKTLGKSHFVRKSPGASQSARLWKHGNLQGHL